MIARSVWLASLPVLVVLVACATGDEPPTASGFMARPAPVAIGHTCRAIKRFMAISREELEAARERIIRVSTDTRYSPGTTYASRLQVPGWSDCTIFTSDDTSIDDPYIDHALQCVSRELSSNRAARRYVNDVYACTGDMFSERSLIEARSGSRYSLIGFDGELSSGGRGIPVDFGETSFANLSVEADVDWADVSVFIHYHFLKDGLRKESTGDDPEEILLAH